MILLIFVFYMVPNVDFPMNHPVNLHMNGLPALAGIVDGDGMVYRGFIAGEKMRNKIGNSPIEMDHRTIRWGYNYH